MSIFPTEDSQHTGVATGPPAFIASNYDWPAARVRAAGAKNREGGEDPPPANAPHFCQPVSVAIDV